MRTKLNKAERKTLESLQDRLSTIYRRLEENDVELHYGNGTAASLPISTGGYQFRIFVQRGFRILRLRVFTTLATGNQKYTSEQR